MKWNLALGTCCLLLLVLNVALFRQNRALKAQLSEPPPSLEVRTGTEVPDLDGFDLHGAPLNVRYGSDSRKVLLLVFAPQCKFCKVNWPRWEELIAQADSRNIRIVAVDVTSTSTEDFVVQHRLNQLPVFLSLDPRVTVRYHLQITPQTILIDPHGKVEKTWSGVLSDSAFSEVKERAGIEGRVVSSQGIHPAF